MTARAGITRNVLANYVAQFYVMAVGVVMAPVYLSYMGAESYGLIGFFTMMAAWFQLLDMGLTPMLLRETARFRGGAVGIETLRLLLRALVSLFGSLAVLGAAVIVSFSTEISLHWLSAQRLSATEVARAVMLMGLAVPLRWMSGLFRSVVNGFEHQVWLGAFSVVIATARFIGVLLVFSVLGTSPVYFFAYQLAVAATELAGLMAMTQKLVGFRIPRGTFSWRVLTSNMTFSFTIAFATTIWVMMTQADKLILSKALPLSGYGVFSIAIVAAGAIFSISGPIAQAVMPRLTRLVAEQDEDGAARFYSSATQIICVLTVPAVVLAAFFAMPLLFVWTGKAMLARQASSILSLYALGNGCVVLSSFAYYIQYAKGDLYLQFVGQAIMVAVLLPLLIVEAERHGGVGTGAVWAGVNAAYFLGWVPLVHARVLKGQHVAWMMRDILPIVVPTAVAGWLLSASLDWSGGRWVDLLKVAVCAAILFALAASGSRVVRDRIVATLEGMRRPVLS